MSADGAKDSKKKNVHKGHRKRMNEEFLKIGMDGFNDHQKIEFLLFHRIEQRDTNPIAHELLSEFKSFSRVFDAEYEDLLEVEGMGPKSAQLIKIVSEIIKTYMNDSSSKNNIITTPDQAVEYIQHLFIGKETECIYLVCMGNNGKVLYCKRVAEGTPETVGVTPSDLIKRALRANAVKAIIAHNHPYGICNPSSQDLRTTSILYDEFKRVDIELCDHIIVASDGVYSMKKKNMFPAGRIKF